MDVNTFPAWLTAQGQRPAFTSSFLSQGANSGRLVHLEIMSWRCCEALAACSVPFENLFLKSFFWKDFPILNFIIYFLNSFPSLCEIPKWWFVLRSVNSDAVKTGSYRRTFGVLSSINCSVQKYISEATFEKGCREHHVTGVWLWTLNNFICSEYCLRAAGFVQRPNSAPARHLAVKVTTGHFECYFRVFNQMSSQVLSGFVDKLLTPTKARVTGFLRWNGIMLLFCMEEVHEKELLSVNKSGRYQELNRINTSRTAHCSWSLELQVSGWIPIQFIHEIFDIRTCLRRPYVLVISLRSSALASYVAFENRNYETQVEKSLLIVKINYIISNYMSCAQFGFNTSSKPKIQWFLFPWQEADAWTTYNRCKVNVEAPIPVSVIAANMKS